MQLEVLKSDTLQHGTIIAHGAKPREAMKVRKPLAVR
jgi:hypothetical protein